MNKRQKQIRDAQVKAKQLELCVIPMQKVRIAQELIVEVIEIISDQQTEINELKDQLWKREQS